MDGSESTYSCELPTTHNTNSTDLTKSTSKECSSHSLTENKRPQKHAKKRKRSSSTGSSSEELQKCKKSKKRKHKKKCKKRHKKSKEAKKLKSENKQQEISDKSTAPTEIIVESEIYGPKIPDDVIQKSQAMAPMSKEKWEEKKNTIRRVYDEETGRNRLVRGDGEVIEEIVSRQRHCEINKQATFNSGAYFQAKLTSKDLP